jgi:hypothetical protein
MEARIWKQGYGNKDKLTKQDRDVGKTDLEEMTNQLVLGLVSH